MTEIKSTYIEIAGSRVVSVSKALEEAVRLAMPTDFNGRANSYSCPLGRDQGVMWVLMEKSDVPTLDLGSGGGSNMSEWTSGNTTIVFDNLFFVSALTMSTIIASDEIGLMLVRLEDARRVLKISDIDASYNVRNPVPPTTTRTAAAAFNADTLNGGSLYTWQTMLNDIWSFLPLGFETPTLPYSPHTNPENYKFIGVNAWDAYNDVLDKLGCAIRYDPIHQQAENAPISIIRLGTTQAELTDNATALEECLIYDYNPTDGRASDIPETIRVYFEYRHVDFGAERDVSPTNNLVTYSHFSKDVTTGHFGTIAGTVLSVWDDLVVYYDDTLMLQDSAIVTARAEEVADNLGYRIVTSNARRDTIQEGYINIVLPGSEIKEVIWRNFEDDEGPVTELLNYPDVTTPNEFYPGEDGRGGGGVKTKSNVMTTLSTSTTPNLSPDNSNRLLFPTTPRETHFVQINTGDQDGAAVTHNGDNVISGQIVSMHRGGQRDLQDCWIRFIDTLNTAGVGTLYNEDYHGPARMAGIFTSGGDTRPFLVITSGGPIGSTQVIPFTLTATLSLGGNASATNLDTSASITVVDQFTSPGRFSGPSGYYGWARKQKPSVGTDYDIINMDRKARFILATLGQDMAGQFPGQSQGSAVTDYWDGIVPISTVTVYDRCGIAKSAKSGDCVICCWDDIDDQYVAITGATAREVFAFTLTGALALGGSAFATNNDTGGAVTVTDVFTAPGKFSGPIGYGGFARIAPDGINEILVMDRKARFIKVTLTTNMAIGISVNVTLSDFWDGITPGTGFTIYDRCNIAPYARIGDCLICSWDDIDGQYVVMTPDASGEVIWFELDAPLTLGLSALATDQDNLASITVVDQFSSPGKFSGPIGYKGFARLAPDGTYEIIQMDRKARFIQVTLTAAMTFGSSSVATVTDFWDGINPTVVTVYDRCNIAKMAQSGECLLCCWDDIDSRYVVLTGDAAGEVFKFTLLGTLAIGGVGSSQTATTDFGTIVTVRDSFSAPGKFSGVINSVGFARVALDGGNDIIVMDRFARFIKATITGAFVAGSAVATVNDFWDGIDPGPTSNIFDRCSHHVSAIEGDCFICCWDDIDDQYVIISGPPGTGTGAAIQYGKAITNWNRGGVGPTTCDWIPVYHVDDCDGGGENTQITYDVYFTEFMLHRPNVIKDKIIGFHKDAKGVYTTTGYQDREFGAVDMWQENGPASTDEGWQFLGAMSDRFPRQTFDGNTDGGDTGGSDTITIQPHTQAQVIATFIINNHLGVTSSTELSIPDHPEHYHKVLGGTGQPISGDSQTEVGKLFAPCDMTDGPHGVSEQGVCSPVFLTHVISPNGHAHAVAGLSHVVVAGQADLAHLGSPFDNKPKYYTLQYYRRIDNAAN